MDIKEIRLNLDPESTEPLPPLPLFPDFALLSAEAADKLAGLMPRIVTAYVQKGQIDDAKHAASEYLRLLRHIYEMAEACDCEACTANRLASDDSIVAATTEGSQTLH
jgi:hypothetical protein